ncbi:MAG: L,D-transpeptidase family protein [Haloferula sp.]
MKAVLFLVSLAVAVTGFAADPVPLDGLTNARKLAPGEFEWNPGRSPDGPLLVVCSLDDQMLYAFRNGIQIARSTISTGREGKRTPTGVFTILQRKIDHESNIYKGAKMPYMQRLTWTGIAMHAGELPGYPASAGCIRLPFEFSKLIYGEMKNGSTVVITEKNATPTQSKSPSSILKESSAPDEADKSIPKGRPIWEPHKSPHGPISILLSYADRTLYVWRNGVQIGQCPVAYDLPEDQLPEGVFLMLDGDAYADPKAPGLTLHSWSVVSLDGDEVKGNVVDHLRENFHLDPTFRKLLNTVVTPGTLFLATRESSTEETRSGPMAIGVPEKE